MKCGFFRRAAAPSNHALNHALESRRGKKPPRLMPPVRDKGMMKSTSKCIGRLGQLLGALLAATLIAKWRLINFIWPAQVDTGGLLGSAVVWFYMLGSLIGAFGLLFWRWWGCVGAYGAALGATMIGIPLIPWLPRLVTVGIARTYAVIVLNAAIIVWAAVVHVRMRHGRSQVRS